MNKNFRIWCFALLAGCSLCTLPSCSEDDDLKERIDQVEQRLDALEEWCTTVNTDLASLKSLVAALEANDYVTGVEKLENGYSISFSKSETITIHDGANGQTPVVGMSKDTDGHYYWTVQDAEGKAQWLTDADGNKIRTTGDDAPVPVMKTGKELGSSYVTDAVYLSIDGGKTWQRVSGKPGADGAQGEQGTQGDSWFKDIDTSNPDYVVFTLYNNTVVRLAKASSFKQDVIPTGIVLMDYSATTITKDEGIQLKIRVNPSGYVLTKENIELDCLSGDTYFAQTDGASTRASYVTPTDYYAIDMVEPDKNEVGETLDGQWLVTILPTGQGNYRNVSDLMPIIKYTDANGEVQRISSQTGISVQTVPSVDEGLVFGYSKVQSIYSDGKTVNPYVLYTNPQVYTNDKGDLWFYDLSLVSNIEADFDQMLLSMDKSGMLDKHRILFTPDLQASLWSGVADGSSKSGATPVIVRMTDFAGKVKLLSFNVTYCPSTIDLYFKFSAAELNAVDDGTLNVNLADELTAYGFSEDVLANLTRKAAVLGQSDDGSMITGIDFPLVLETCELLDEQDNLFKPSAEFWIHDTAKAGQKNYGYGEAIEQRMATVQVGFQSFPLGVQEPAQLVFTNVRMFIDIID